MKKKRLLVLLGSICLVLVLAACAAPAPAPPTPTPTPTPTPAPTPTPPEVFELKFANYFPTPARQSTVLEEFCREVELRTDGRVKFDYYAGGALLKAPAMFDGIVTGIADIGYSHVYYTPGRMAVTEVTGLPLGSPSAWVGAQFADDFYNEFKPKEWDEVEVLWIHVNNPSLIKSTKPVRTLEDMKGVTIRAPGLAGEIIAALGGTPAPTPMMEVYDAIAKGTIDGEYSPYETLKSFKFAEVVGYTTVSWQAGTGYPFYVVMNKDSYNKLNLAPEVKGIFDEVCGEYKEKFALAWNAIDFEGKEFGEEQGVEFIELSPAEAARWQAAVEPVIDKYVGDMVEKGFSEAEVRGWIEFLRERIDYWTVKQIEWRIPSPTGPEEIRP